MLISIGKLFYFIWQIPTHLCEAEGTELHYVSSEIDNSASAVFSQENVDVSGLPLHNLSIHAAYKENNGDAYSVSSNDSPDYSTLPSHVSSTNGVSDENIGDAKSVSSNENPDDSALPSHDSPTRIVSEENINCANADPSYGNPDFIALPLQYSQIFTVSEETSKPETPDFSTLPPDVWVRVLKLLNLKDQSSVAQTCRANNVVFCQYTSRASQFGSKDDHNNDNSGSDFSILPDHVWVQVMQMLSIKDRGNLAQTCSAINEVLHHPSLWTTHTLTIKGSIAQNYNPKSLLVPSQSLQATKRFGRYFQNITLTLTGHFREITQQIKEYMHDLSKDCKGITSLTIDFKHRTQACYFKEYGCDRHQSFFDGLATILKHASNTRRLNIVSWPSFGYGRSPEISDAIQTLEMDTYLQQNLEHLSLFWNDDLSLSEQRPILPTPTETFAFVSKFERLISLSLRPSMLSDDLLICLASLAALETLQIAVHYCNDVINRYQVPRLQPQTWRTLVQNHSRLRVEVTLLRYTPDNQLFRLLTAEVPVSKFCITTLAWVPVATLTKLQKLYRTTLQEFTCYSTRSSMDDKLLKLCESCENLTRFVFHGRIRVETVTRIAKLRGHAWDKFEVKAANLIAPSQDDKTESITVVYKSNPNSMVKRADMYMLHDERSTHIIQKMTEEVSESLGRRWKPSLIK